MDSITVSSMPRQGKATLNVVEPVAPRSAPDALQRRFFAVASLKPKQQPNGEIKLDKAPLTPGTLAHAETNDIDTLGTYTEAMEAVRLGRAKICGPVLKRDGAMCIDLDKAIGADGQLSPGAQHILSYFPDALVTVSVSGQGLHIWIKAKPPFTKACENFYYDGQKVEVLAEKFVAETWKPFGTPGQFKPFQAELETMLKETLPKPAPATTAPASSSRNNGALSAYERAALDGKLKDARAKMSAAGDNERHDVRLKLSRLLGGLLHYNHFTEEDAFNALALNFGANVSSAQKTIRDGLKMGRNEPITIDAPSLAPQIIGRIGNGLSEHNGTSHEYSEAPTEPEPRKPRYELFGLQQLATMPRLEWLVRGLLLEKISSVISADSGGFKSFFAEALGLCVALGVPFMGRETKQGNVVYIAAEGFYTIYDRALAFCLHHGCEMPENFHVLKVPINLGDPATVLEFASEVEAVKPALVILDTLSQCAVGANENDNAQMADFVRGMMALADRIGAHVTVLHHNGKASGTFRGAGSIKANVDAHITMEKPEGDESNTVFVRCEKQRGRPFEPFALRGIEVELPHTDEYGDPVTSLVFEPCGDEVTAQSAKHPNSQRADKTAEALLKVFDEVANEAAGMGIDGVKVGFWKEKAVECDEPICKPSTFWRYRSALEKKGAIVQEGMHNGSPLYRRANPTLTTPTTPNESIESNPKSKSPEQLSQLSHYFSSESSESKDDDGAKTAATLPNMPKAKPKAKRNTQADSEHYKPASDNGIVADDIEVEFDDER